MRLPSRLPWDSPGTGRSIPAQLAGLPVVPAAAAGAACTFTSSEQKAHKPDDQCREGQPPQHVDNETQAAQDQDDQERDENDCHRTSPSLTTLLVYPRHESQTGPLPVLGPQQSRDGLLS